MKSFKLLELLLISNSEKRAKRISFHPEVTLIKGANDTGKSSVVKSIYHNFGATPANIHVRWKKANVSSLVKFSVDSSVYKLYRHGNSYSLFNNNDGLIGTYDSVTNELGPKLSDLFDFKLRLATHKNETIIPPPAFFLLPFYIDQDSGWTKNWNSFEKLGQFKGWRRDLVYYHTGIHPNEWYELKARERTLESEKEEPLRQETVLKNLIIKLKKQLSTVNFDIDVKSYKKEIDRLLKHCEVLSKKENTYKEKLIELETEKIRLDAQKEIVMKAKSELFADYNFATLIDEEAVDCPTCGATYSNSFAERFNIACDEDRCVNLLQGIRENLDKITNQIEDHKNFLEETSDELIEVNSLLESKQGEITLRVLIENEGKKEVAKTLQANLDEIQSDIAKIDNELREIKILLKKYIDKKRANEIKAFYRSSMRRNLNLLDVSSLEESAYKKIEASIKETGSDQPRALLAYFFSILQVIEEYGSSAFCPIIIDAPNQQEQDEINLRKMLDFIRANKPSNSQMVLALVDDCSIDFGGDIIQMDEKNYALSEREYSNVSGEISYYAEANLGII